MKEHIIIQGAYEKNLKHLSLAIPRNQLVVFTGVSGSGKTTLLFDVIFQEAQRQYLEAMGFLGIDRPKVESIKNLSPAIHISQTYKNRNPRSTVGTVTDIYTGLRMVFEQLSLRICEHCNHTFAQDIAAEEVVRTKDSTSVYSICPSCKQRVPKLTVSHFSFNTDEGACPDCQGLGVVWDVDLTSLLDETLTLEEGAVRLWKHRYKEYEIGLFNDALAYYELPPVDGLSLAAFSAAQRNLLLYGCESEQFTRLQPSKAAPKTSKFEGVSTMLLRRLSEHKGLTKDIKEYLVQKPCSTCNGEHLNTLSRTATVMNTRLPELSQVSLQVLLQWVESLDTKLTREQHHLIGSYLLDLSTKIKNVIQVGLGYLSLDRQVITLSAGETQRLRLASSLDSELTSIIYILDEPTVGLHPSDTQELVAKLKMLRDKGNSVFVIEHDPSVIKEADSIIELGPGAGRHGGLLLANGTLYEVKNTPSSLIGFYLQEQNKVLRISRKPEHGYLQVKDASLHNLKHLDVRFPLGLFTVVTGLSGSGKTTLVFDILAKDTCLSKHFDEILLIDQPLPWAMKRSTVATFMDFYTPIREIFAKEAIKNTSDLSAKSFSFNSPGGRCERCEGLGTITSNLLFFEGRTVPCPLCKGKQFNENVLSVLYKGHSIHDILQLTVEEAALLFTGFWAIQQKLTILQDVGLGYLELGQTLPSLSGGEAQRLKLAKALLKMPKETSRTLFLMDEPTIGLHPQDVEHFNLLLQEFVRRGATLIVVEHNLQLIRQSDWIVDLGPGGGDKGGELLYAGPLPNILDTKESLTARYLRTEGY
ncbi:MAG: excinuclease ABC subunit UvrA [Sphaerochaeta sp.]